MDEKEVVEKPEHNPDDVKVAPSRHDVRAYRASLRETEAARGSKAKSLSHRRASGKAARRRHEKDAARSRARNRR